MQFKTSNQSLEEFTSIESAEELVKDEGMYVKQQFLQTHVVYSTLKRNDRFRLVSTWNLHFSGHTQSPRCVL